MAAAEPSVELYTMPNGVVLKQRNPMCYSCNLDASCVDVKLPIVTAALSAGNVGITPAKICVMGTGTSGAESKHIESLVKCLQAALEVAHSMDKEAYELAARYAPIASQFEKDRSDLAHRALQPLTVHTVAALPLPSLPKPTPPPSPVKLPPVTPPKKKSRPIEEDE
jgi:hypothetical protein